MNYKQGNKSLFNPEPESDCTTKDSTLIRAYSLRPYSFYWSNSLLSSRTFDSITWPSVRFLLLLFLLSSDLRKRVREGANEAALPSSWIKRKRNSSFLYHPKRIKVRRWRQSLFVFHLFTSWKNKREMKAKTSTPHSPLQLGFSYLLHLSALVLGRIAGSFSSSFLSRGKAIWRTFTIEHMKSSPLRVSHILSSPDSSKSAYNDVGVQWALSLSVSQALSLSQFFTFDFIPWPEPIYLIY